MEFPSQGPGPSAMKAQTLTARAARNSQTVHLLTYVYLTVCNTYFKKSLFIISRETKKALCEEGKGRARETKGKAEDSARRAGADQQRTAAPSSQSFPSCSAPPGRDAECTSWMPQTPAGPGSPGGTASVPRTGPRAGAEGTQLPPADSSRHLLDCLSVCLSVCLSAGKHSASGSMRR